MTAAPTGTGTGAGSPTGLDRLDFACWVAHFTAEAAWRAGLGDPDWSRGARASAALLRSLQKFQVGEDGDGTRLIAKAEAAGDPDYAAAVRLFVAEEQNHARLLAALLAAAGTPLLGSHWSDALFVRFRRMLGLRLELMVLLVAEVVAVPYYRAVRDGAADGLVAEVAGRIAADELRHIPFHCLRLRESIGLLPTPLHSPAIAFWRLLATAAAGFVALDHGPALRALGVGRLHFVLRSAAVAAEAARALGPAR
ncbi:ferritin-like domain-containing protein [Streptomyces sp. NRRL B-24484]|uniref:ferritin-like domain-containing protein n=1 Tax=Streptomyces sp. NRRL B-24484 TaxID=1463833 RepID=UPI000B01BC47|nr:ferritin-like domain-containing protein [Streptomyces sp. NRRL B-24484]